MMRRKRRRLVILACVLSAGWASMGEAASRPPSPGGPDASNPARRIASFARIPDWRGFWEIHDIGASGTPDPHAVERSTAGEVPVFTDAWVQRMKTETKHNPLTDRVCTFGFPTLVESSPLIFEFVSVPEETVMIFNGRELRHIYTDGEGHTPEDIRITTPWGDSTGHWDGGVLSVETTASNGLFRFRNAQGQRDSTVLSEGALFRERIRRIDADTLEDQVTVEDHDALRQPYHFTRQFHRIPKMIRVAEELDCEASGTNDRNPIVDGKYTLTPPKD